MVNSTTTQKENLFVNLQVYKITEKKLIFSFSLKDVNLNIYLL